MYSALGGALTLCRYEKLQGGGADVSTEEKQKKGLFKKVKDAVRSPSKDDTVCLDTRDHYYLEKHFVQASLVPRLY